jgi:hypothetical protein
LPLEELRRARATSSSAQVADLGVTFGHRHPSWQAQWY